MLAFSFVCQRKLIDFPTGKGGILQLDRENEQRIPPIDF
jgi:hypothetical protein